MIALLNFVLATVNVLPCEYVIDFGAEAVPFAYKMVFDLEARDGTRTGDWIAEWAENTNPNNNRAALLYLLNSCGWEARRGPGNSLIITGRSDGKKSPIRSVTLKSDKAIPVQVRWVPLVPGKK